MAFNFIVSISIFIIVVLLILLVAFPNEKEKSKRKREKLIENTGQKDWEEVVSKLEKHIQTLKLEIEKAKSESFKTQRSLALEKEKCEKLQEKLFREKDWLSKEEDSADKKTREIRDLKQNLIKLQTDFDNEFALRLRLEQQLKDVKGECEALNNEKRDAALKLKKAEAEAEYFKKESAQLKKANVELKKESNEVQWVAKSEYEKLERLLREKEKELERVSRNPGS